MSLTVINHNASTNQPTPTPGLYSLHLLAADLLKSVNMTLRIPRQTIYLVGYRIEYDTAAHALADKLVYVDLPFLSPSQLIDNQTDFSLLMCPLDNAALTFVHGINRPVYLSKDIPERYDIKLRKFDGSLITSNFVSITLQFTLSYGAIN